MRLPLILLLLFSGIVSAEAQVAKMDWALESGKLTYHVHYPLKNVEGTSTSVKGKGQCDKTKCDFLIAVPLKSFESGDGNRDNHMLEVTKAGLHPMILVKVSFAASEVSGISAVAAQITMAGETHNYSGVSLTRVKNGDVTVVKDKIPLVLSDFKVERPSLLAVKVDDLVPVDFELTWK